MTGPLDAPADDRRPTADAAPRLEAQGIAVSLTVADLSRSVAWYRDVLGFAVGREFRRDDRFIAARMVAGAMELLLTQDNGARGSDRVKGEGFSMQVTTGQNIDALAARITARGGTLDDPPADAFGARVFRLRDPDGFRLVFSSPRPQPL